MTLEQAIALIEPGIPKEPGNWADIGAGTGMFTKALEELLSGGTRGSGGSKIYAVDKSPHALWQLQSTPEVEIVVTEADFNISLDLPPLDGIIMANALHYADDHAAALKNVLHSLKDGGSFILVEYDTETSNPPWVPYPVSFRMFQTLCEQLNLKSPAILGTVVSQYGNGDIYAVKTGSI